MAVTHLINTDPRWTEVIDWVGPCRLRPSRDRFGTLVRAIIGQQISTKAAASIDARLRAIGGTPHDPARLLELGLETIRTAGLSGVKASYLLNLSEAVVDGRLPLRRIGAWDNEAIIERLTAIKGIGRWTAEMFLVFALNRPDVLSVGDLGVRVGLRNHHALTEVPTPRECEALAEPWRPYRTVAMWYLWRGLERPGSRA
jgi:DNA-3-methyladenine glycosylase II